MFAIPTKYAIRAVSSLAEQPKDVFVKVTELAKSARVPAPFLSKIVKDLAQAGIVETRKGFSGGVRLLESKRGSSLYEIACALGDPATDSYCILAKQKCSDVTPCEMHASWSKMKVKLNEFLKEARPGTNKKR